MRLSDIKSIFQKKKIRTIARLLFSLLIISVLLYSVNPASVVAVLVTMNHMLLLVALLLYACTFLILSYRWRYILSKMGYKIPLLTAYQAFAAGVLISDITPARLGELSRPFALKGIVPIHTGLVSVLADRYMDIVVIFILGTTGLVFISSVYDMTLIPVLLVLIFLLATPVLFFWMDRERAIRIAGWTGSVRLIDFLRSLDEVISQVTQVRKLFLIGISFTFFSWIFQAARIMTLCYATGYYVPISDLILLQPLVSALSLIPVSVAGLGLVEGGYAAMLTLFGVPLATGMAIALMDRVLTVSFHIIIGSRFVARMI